MAHVHVACLQRAAEIAPERKPQCGTDFVHSLRTQLGDPPAQPFLRNRKGVVQIHGALVLHPIRCVQDHLGGHAADGGRYGSNRDRRKVGDGAVTREDNHRPLFVGRREVIKADIAASYSAGQVASDSHRRASPRACGRDAYPARSRSSRARTSNLNRCSLSASRTRAERLRCVRRAARSVASRSFLSSTIWTISIMWNLLHIILHTPGTAGLASVESSDLPPKSRIKRQGILNAAKAAKTVPRT